MRHEQASRKAPPRPRFDVLAAGGDPTEEELQAAREAISRFLVQERKAAATSLWLRAARAQGRRLGMYDYRDRFSSDDAWRLSSRFPAGGREYPGLVGRGDAR